MAQKRKNDGITGQTPAEAIQADLLADGYPVTITRAQAKLIDAAAAIMLDPEPTDADRAFLARQLVQVTLPHSNPGDVPIWRRRNGRLTLTLRPYTDNDGKPLHTGASRACCCTGSPPRPSGPEAAAWSWAIRFRLSCASWG